MSIIRHATTNKVGKGGYVLSKEYDRFRDFIKKQKVKNVIHGLIAVFRQVELKMIDSTIDYVALMPLYMPEIPILSTAKEGDVVLDTFS